MEDCNVVSIPIKTGINITSAYEDQPSVPENLIYQSMIGSLIYATTCTQPDISYLVCLLSRYLSNPHRQQKECSDLLEELCHVVLHICIWTPMISLMIQSF